MGNNLSSISRFHPRFAQDKTVITHRINDVKCAIFLYLFIYEPTKTDAMCPGLGIALRWVVFSNLMAGFPSGGSGYNAKCYGWAHR